MQHTGAEFYNLLLTITTHCDYICVMSCTQMWTSALWTMAAAPTAVTTRQDRLHAGAPPATSLAPTSALATVSTEITRMMYVWSYDVPEWAQNAGCPCRYVKLASGLPRGSISTRRYISYAGSVVHLDE